MDTCNKIYDESIIFSEKYKYTLKEFFSRKFSLLESIDIKNLEELFIGIPLNLFPRNSDNTIREFDIEEIREVLKIFIEYAKSINFHLYNHPVADPKDKYLPQPQEHEKLEKLIDILVKHPTLQITGKVKGDIKNIINSNSIPPPYLLVIDPKRLNQLAYSYYQFINQLHKKKNFVFYIARDSGPIFEADTYISQVTNQPKRCGLIYHGGLRVMYKKETLKNKIFADILEGVTNKFLVDDEDIKLRIFDYWHEGMRAPDSLNKKLSPEYSSKSDEKIFELFISSVQKESFKILEAGKKGGKHRKFYKQSKEYYMQMKRTGVFKSNMPKVTFFDTQGSGKTTIYSKIVFDYFSKQEGKNIESEVLLGNRFSNYVDKGWSKIPGFPVVKNLSEYESILKSDKDLFQENDIQPFFANDVNKNGESILYPSTITAQVLSLYRSLINGNAAIKHSAKSLNKKLNLIYD